ncbi:pyrimidine dimer DNA glycosylase/endonuclease V [Nocardioides panacisoli]|uniref:Uncharacterized protein n=1 Tax=Nocardioides panacisoli TaxID=627624 RepID=A0ABP7IUT2_9ACTN
MQTFLPYADFARSARSLDPKRLGKQRVEALQVVRALTTAGYGWAKPSGGADVEGLRGGTRPLRAGVLRGLDGARAR